MIIDHFRLDGRCALVTGAARGIGAAIAVALAEAGATVVALDVLPCDETIEAIRSCGASAHTMKADLEELDSVLAANTVVQATRAAGPLDILVNNAGIIHREPAITHAEEDWERVLHVDLTSVFLLSQAFAQPLLDAGRQGKIVNVCSMLSFQGGRGVVSYAAAKSGLAGLTRALANEWAPRGINVNAIAPGYLATEVTADIRSDPERETAILARIPAGRWGEPRDVAGATVFLCSDAAAYMHGVVLPVDGGWLAW